MRRFFVKNLLFVLALNVLVKPVWIFLIDRTVQNRVGHAVYGTYQALFNLGIIFQIVLDFGLSYYNTRMIAQQPEKLKKIFPVLLSARLLFVGIYICMVAAIGIIAGYNIREFALLGGVLLIQVLNSFIQFLRSNISALQRFRADGLLSIADRLLMILLCGYLLFPAVTRSHFRIEWFIAAQIFSYTVAVVLGFYLLKRLSGIRLSFSLDFKKISEIVRGSLPYATLIFLMAIHTRVDTVLLERLSADGKIQAGIYAAAYRLLDVGNMFGLLFAGMLLPLFGRMIVQKQDIHPIVKLCVDVMLPVSLIAALSAAFFGNSIMHLLYTSATDKDGQVFALLMGSFPAYCMMYIYSTLLTANGNLKLLNRIAIAGVAINLSFNALLIPSYHAVGAAYTALITQTTLALCFMIFAGKNMQLPRNPGWILRHTGFFALILLAGYTVSSIKMVWYEQWLVFLLIGGILIFLFRFISITSIKQLVNRK